MKYNNEELAELCAHINLLEYAGNAYDFRKRGADSYACSCPRHTDITPSLFITPSKNLFHCFSCGVSGNIINWMMTFESLSFQKAVEKLSQLAGIDLNSLKQCEAMSLYKAMYQMRQNRECNKASQSREILKPSSIEQYINEIPEEWEQEGIHPAILKKYNIRIDTTGNRIVYPIYDANGELIGFKGRTRIKQYKELGIKKYQNYQKIGTTDFFVGMKENVDSIKQHDTVIIFEGIKSGMKVESWGKCDFWLASETSCLNEAQIRILIQMHIKNVIIAYDNDVPLAKIRKQTKKLQRFTNVYAIYDRNKLLGDKSEKLSPCDKGEEIWSRLLKEKLKL